jgi:hypothetical protein
MSTSFSLKDRVGPAKNPGRDKEKFTSQTTFTCQSIFSSFLRIDSRNKSPRIRPHPIDPASLSKNRYFSLHSDYLNRTASPSRPVPLKRCGFYGHPIILSNTFSKKSSKRRNLVTIPFENAIFDASGGNVLRDNRPEYHGRP